MKPYLEKVSSVLNEYKTDEKKGLSHDEAQKRLQQDGPNKLKEGKKEPLWKKFLHELSEPMLIILMVAAVLSVGTSYLNGEPEWADAIIILIVVLINAILGVVQEAKAEAAIEALQEIAAAQSKVMRDGYQKTIPSEEIVKGDIVLLEAGDSVPADARIIEHASLKSDKKK